MYPPFETVLDGLSRKIILGNCTLKTHGHVRTEAAKIEIPCIIKTSRVPFCFEIQRETGLFISLVRVFQHGCIRISGESANHPQNTPIRTISGSIYIREKYPFLGYRLQIRHGVPGIQRECFQQKNHHVRFIGFQYLGIISRFHIHAIHQLLSLFLRHKSIISLYLVNMHYLVQEVPYRINRSLIRIHIFVIEKHETYVHWGHVKTSPHGNKRNTT